MELRTTRTNFDRLEFRRDRRYPVPPLRVRIQGRDYASLNWSLGGVRIDASDLGLTVGDGVAGELLIDQIGHSYTFTAVVTWSERSEGDVGLKFVEIAPECVEALDRSIVRWMKRGRH